MTIRNPTPLLWRLWLSRFFKAFASGIGAFAIQWVATSFPNPTIAVAYSNTVGRSGQVFSGYLAGWVSDHVSPVMLMILSNFLGAVFTVFLGLMLQHDRNLFSLLLLVVVWNALNVVSRAASVSLVPQMVAPERLPHVNSWMGTVEPIRQFVASGLAGILIAGGVFHAFLASGIAFAVAGILLYGRGWPTQISRSKKPRRLSLGIQIAWATPTLRMMVLFTSVLNFGFSFYLGEYVLFLRQHDHFSAPQIGIGLAMGTLGVIGALVAGPHVIRRHPAWVPLAGPSFVAAGVGIVALCPHLLGFALGDMAINFGSSIASQIVALTRQRTVPIEVMGSVSGALSLFHGILVPLGMATAGMLAYFFGPAIAVWGGVVLVSVSLVVAIPFAKTVSQALLPREPKVT